jgi:hypothetical protein
MTEDKQLFDSFPAYVGFGLLDRSSMCLVESPQNDPSRGFQGLPHRHVRALYRTREGEVVYCIEISNESCFVEEFWDGRAFAWTRFKTLKEALFQKFFTTDWDKHPRLLAIQRRLSAAGNITFPNLSRRGVMRVYLPCGLVFGLFIPVYNREKLTRIEELVGSKGEPFLVEGVFPGTIVQVADDDFSVTLEDYPVALISVGLMDLEYTVRYCFEKNLVSGESRQELGIHVLDQQHINPGSFIGFLGRGKSYSIVIKREGDLSVNEALRKLRVILSS